MHPVPAILIYDRDALFREALRNFLLAAGYSRVEAVATVREALAKLRGECYGHVLIGVSRPLARTRRVAWIAQRRQADAKIFLLIDGKDQPFVKDLSFDYVIKEGIFSILLELMQNTTQSRK